MPVSRPLSTMPSACSHAPYLLYSHADPLQIPPAQFRCSATGKSVCPFGERVIAMLISLWNLDVELSGSNLRKSLFLTEMMKCAASCLYIKSAFSNT